MPHSAYSTRWKARFASERSAASPASRPPAARCASARLWPASADRPGSQWMTYAAGALSAIAMSDAVVKTGAFPVSGLASIRTL